MQWWRDLFLICYGNHRTMEWVPIRALLLHPLLFSLHHQLPFPQAWLSSIQINRRRYQWQSPSSSMKSWIIFLPKFIWRFFPSLCAKLCHRNFRRLSLIEKYSRGKGIWWGWLTKWAGQWYKNLNPFRSSVVFVVRTFFRCCSSSSHGATTFQLLGEGRVRKLNNGFSTKKSCHYRAYFVKCPKDLARIVPCYKM